MSAETPTTNMARVASMKGAPSIAPIPIGAPSSEASPVRTGSRMATMAIMLSGKAVPTAASRLPTAPWRIPRRPPSISIAFVKNAAPRRIATSATTNSTVVNIAHLLSDGPRNAKKRAIAACLPANGLARGAWAPVTGRKPRSVLTTGPPATAGGYSPIARDSTRQAPDRQRDHQRGQYLPAAWSVWYAGSSRGAEGADVQGRRFLTARAGIRADAAPLRPARALEASQDGRLDGLPLLLGGPATASQPHFGPQGPWFLPGSDRTPTRRWRPGRATAGYADAEAGRDRAPARGGPDATRARGGAPPADRARGRALPLRDSSQAGRAAHHRLGPRYRAHPGRHADPPLRPLRRTLRHFGAAPPRTGRPRVRPLPPIRIRRERHRHGSGRGGRRAGSIILRRRPAPLPRAACGKGDGERRPPGQRLGHPAGDRRPLHLGRGERLRCGRAVPRDSSLRARERPLPLGSFDHRLDSGGIAASGAASLERFAQA